MTSPKPRVTPDDRRGTGLPSYPATDGRRPFEPRICTVGGRPTRRPERSSSERTAPAVGEREIGMSDPRSSVRTQDTASTGESGPASVSTTQAIPGTGSFRAQSPAAPGGAPTGGSPAAAATAAAPAAKQAQGGRTGRAARAAGRGPRRARLQLRHIDIWSAFKISLVLSIAMFFIWMVAVGVLYGVLNSLDVFDTVNDLFSQIGSASGEESGSDVVTPGLV